MANPGVTTLLALRTSCKQQSDNAGQSFISDPEWNGYVGAAYQELYGLIVQAFGTDYFTQGVEPYQFTTNGTGQYFPLPDGSATYLLPSGATAPAFFKLLGVDLAIPGQNAYVSLKPFAFADRNQWSAFNSSIPPAGQIVRVFYAPRLILPTLDADLIDGVNGWEDYIVSKACMYALAKEESDVSVFMARIAAMEKRLASEVENRDAANSAKIVDTLGRGARGMQYRLNGNSLWLIGGVTPGWVGDWGGDYAGRW
jgi:hypothetical protein